MEIEQFFVIGINYKKTDAGIRGEFAVNTDQYASLLQNAATQGLHELFVLSTCNRTEVYAVAADPSVLIDLLCHETTGDADTFRQLCYIKQGKEAVAHIFCVGAGLDSQILGDYEIVGQMKQAVKFARERGFIGGFTERLYNTVLQSSKLIKNRTALSGGTISVSFAAIQFLKAHMTGIPGKKIVLLGTGKIGRNTCKNLVDYLETTNITLINRTEEKANDLAAELGLRAVGYECMEQEIATADVVIVATNSDTPVITRESLAASGPKILIDLSIPNNIEASAGTLPHITLANVDDLSLINDHTLEKRRAEVPAAMAIISDHTSEFFEWYELLRRHVPVLKAVKQKLYDMYSCRLFLADPRVHDTVNKTAIQEVVNNVARKMRRQHQPGCYYIEAINDFMTTN